MKEYNNTAFPLSYIESLPLVGKCRSNWRGRDILLYQSDNPDMVYSVGRNADMTVICYEDKKGWSATLQMFPQLHVKQ